MTTMKLIRITLILIITASTSFNSRTENSGTEVVEKLEALGYFKYADSGKVAELKSDLIKSFDNHGVLSTVTDDETLLPYDYRFYFCDGEALFEMGGLEVYLGYAKHAFERRGLNLEWDNEIFEEKRNNLNHRITVNGKEYVAFQGTMQRLDVWGVSQLNFYRMLNDQLEIQGSDERIYPISGGENGHFLFLTKELFDYISTTFYQGKDLRKWEIPYPVEKWKEVSGLK